jgi:adenylylsulfate kinase
MQLKRIIIGFSKNSTTNNMIYWFTGQPGHGKTVLAKSLNAKYFSNKAFHVDGDDLREIFDNKDYSEVGRRKNIELAQHISHFLNNKGETVIVSLVSPYKDQREEFKEKMGDNIKEIYVHTTEIRGRENFHVKEYESPLHNFLSIDTTNISVEDCLNKIKSYAELG